MGGGERQRVVDTAVHCSHFHQTESEHSAFQINRGGKRFGSVTVLLVVERVKRGAHAVTSQCVLGTKPRR